MTFYETTLYKQKMSQKEAVAKISHWYFQILEFKRTAAKRTEELQFIQMKTVDMVGNSKIPSLFKPFKNRDMSKLVDTECYRREKRHFHEQDYNEALVTVKEVVAKVDGPDMKD